MRLDDLVKEGFNLMDGDHRQNGLAVSALKIAFNSYFKTYQSMKMIIPYILDGERKDEFHHFKYFEFYGETIVHFQHFAELVCKEILRQQHELLVLEPGRKKHVILYKLLNDNRLDESEIGGLNTIEAGATLERLVALINAGLIDEKYKFILNHKNTIQKLNYLRNRIWHRGTYILNYRALDVFIGMYVIPFINDVLELSNELRIANSIWHYGEIHTSINILKEIETEAKKGFDYDLTKVAFLKELGRAAYEHNNNDTAVVDSNKQERVKRTAQTELNADSEVGRICFCPICGMETLAVIFYDEIRCFNCSLNIISEGGIIKNPKEYGLTIEEEYFSY
ncbi:hypothetical protein [Bacillus sp. m3-13]|uniref:hypothetical protein n=1 Tax=Bacillus sp. m3-13 TaxID=406124 RepID=UPI0001E8944A|nr:hypothetical protein [Bacillus sp. m3-13]